MMKTRDGSVRCEFLAVERVVDRVRSRRAELLYRQAKGKLPFLPAEQGRGAEIID